MHKRGNKPDLLFVVAVVVLAGVLATTTVKAAQSVTEPQGWQLAIKAEPGCEQGLGAWQSCYRWHQPETDNSVRAQGIALNLFHNQFPELGVVWYFRQEHYEIYSINNEIDTLSPDGPTAGIRSNQHFGMALRQQYQQFGLQLGFETDYGVNENADTRLYLGFSNRW